jgi:photosystem II stability/assembly factor-like uncharacterized protein
MKKILLFAFTMVCGYADAQWTSQASGTTDGLRSISFISKDTGYIASTSGRILKTTNGGNMWNQVVGPFLPDGINQIHFISSSTGFAASYGKILKTTDGGSNWTNTYTDSNSTVVFCLSFPTDSLGFALSQDLTDDTCFVYRTIDGGNNWSKIYSVSSVAPSTYINFIDSSIGYFYCDLGLMRTIDGGFSWTPISSVGGGDIDFLSMSVGFQAGGVDAITMTTDSGFNWTPQVTPVTAPIYALDFIDLDTGYAVGGNGFSGAIIKTVDGGNNWTISSSSVQTLNDVQFPANNVGYACGEGGSIYKYSPSLGIGDLKDQDLVSVFPNPSNGEFKVASNNLDNLVYTVSVIDLLGNTIQRMVTSNSTLDVDISKQAKGFYFVRIECEESALMKKIIIQ